jgi:hypothetical protein
MSSTSTTTIVSVKTALVVISTLVLWLAEPVAATSTRDEAAVAAVIPMKAPFAAIIVEMMAPTAFVPTAVLVAVILPVRWNHHRLPHVALAAPAMIRVK